jgi:hypothetical protein
LQITFSADLLTLAAQTFKATLAKTKENNITVFIFVFQGVKSVILLT